MLTRGIGPGAGCTAAGVCRMCYASSVRRMPPSAPPSTSGAGMGASSGTWGLPSARHARAAM
jgi:hypothetical protein